MRLLVSGGGTGGHVYPILAVLDALALPSGSASLLAQESQEAPAATQSKPSVRHGQMDSAAESPVPGGPLPGAPAAAGASQPAAGAARPSASRGADEAHTADAVLYVGTAGSAEEELAARAGIAFRAIESGQVRGMRPWEAAGSLAKVAKGSRQAGAIMKEFGPDAVLVTGGFVAVPVVWAAWRAGAPVFIYLPDVEPGLAIRRLSRFATKVGVSFPEVASFFPGKAVVTGYPVRAEVLALAGQREAAKRRLSLAPNEPVLLVFGGSRGARSINEALAAALPSLLPRCQVVHVSGTLDWPQVQARAQGLPEALRSRYRAYAYLHEEMPVALAAADLVVARAGASTLGEFPALGLPSILAPYPYSGQHQEVNADYLASRGAARKVLDADLAARLAPTVLGLLDNPAELAAMRTAAEALARPDAAAHIAHELRQLAQPAD